MPASQLGDFLSLTTHDGQVLSFPDQDFGTVVWGGGGSPPVTWITRQGYKQHGETELGYVLQKRPITLHLHRNHACSRGQYWANRALIHDFLRHNRLGPLTLTVTQAPLKPSAPTYRSIVVRADPGLALPEADDREAGWFIDEDINFVAFDPIWFDPTAITITLPLAVQQNLIFPITFPIIFGTSGLLYVQSILYAGSWNTYPTIILNGPYNAATITNTFTGATITLNVPILAGQQRIISTQPGNLSIVDGQGNNQFGDLGPTSDLVDFFIQALPLTNTPAGLTTTSTGDTLGSTCTATSTTLSVTGAYTFTAGQMIQIETEQLFIAVANPGSIIVIRGVNGTNAAGHTAGKAILLAPVPNLGQTITATLRGGVPAAAAPYNVGAKLYYACGMSDAAIYTVSPNPFVIGSTILIDSEQMTITGVSSFYISSSQLGSQLVVTRGVNGTAKASHSANATVFLELTNSSITMSYNNRYFAI